MPLPVIADAYQVKLVWTAANAPRQATNTFNVLDTAGTNDEADVYAAVNTAVTQTMWDVMGGTAKAETVIVTKLDGVSAAESFATGGPAKWQAGGAGEMILQGCAVVTLRSALRGPKYRNRVFLPFVNEASQANGTLTAAQVTTMQSAWSTFRTALETALFPILVVSPTDNQGELCTSVVVRPYVKTQRRRARR